MFKILVDLFKIIIAGIDLLDTLGNDAVLLDVHLTQDNNHLLVGTLFDGGPIGRGDWEALTLVQSFVDYNYLLLGSWRSSCATTHQQCQQW